MARPIWTRHNGETIRETPNLIVCRYDLANGQMLSVWFRRTRNRGQIDRRILYVWTVAVHIGRGRKEANRWRQDGRRNPITGRGGLEGLSVACRYVLAFAHAKIGARSALQVGWADEKRRRAYRYLLRYEGFSIQHGEDGRPVCIEYRDPAAWVDTTKGEGQDNGGSVEG